MEDNSILMNINWENIKINNCQKQVIGSTLFKDFFSDNEIKDIQKIYDRKPNNRINFRQSVSINNIPYKYRTKIEVGWNNTDNKKLGFIMFNPSFANLDRPDQTLRNIINFADKEGYNSIIVYNLFSIRISGARVVSNYYNNLKEYNPKIDTENLPDDVVLAWGKLPKGIIGIDKVIDNLYQKLKDESKNLYQITKEDFQRHPAIINIKGGIKNLLLFPIKEGKIYKFEAS